MISTPKETPLHSAFIPAEDKKSRRLLIMLHGLGDSLEGFRWLPEALNLPWLNYLLVNAPDEYYGGFFLYDFFWGIWPGPPRRSKVIFGFVGNQTAQRFSSPQNVFGGVF